MEDSKLVMKNTLFVIKPNEAVEFISDSKTLPLFLQARKRVYMNTCAYIRTCVLLLWAALLTACGETFDFAEEHPAKPSLREHEVVIRASQPAMSRTEMGPVGDGSAGSSQEIRWTVGDRILVWAESHSSGSYVIDGLPFTLATFNATYHSADFMATVGTMAEERYTYTALYPLPASQNGTTVSYTLPTAQRGQYDPALDVMTATADGNALSPSDGFHTEIDWEQPELAFEHLFHLIRIRIPEGKNHLGLPIKRLEITFPQEVVGTVSFDVLDPVHTQSWSNLSNKITVDLPDEQLVDAGDGYIWLHIKPTALSGEITFCAYDEAGVKSYDISTTLQKAMEAQRITPIALTVPPPHIPVVYLDLREQANHLGEAWQKITLSGLNFGNGTPNGTTNSVTINATDEDYIVAVYPTLNNDGTANMESVQSKTLTATYESQNALLKNKTLTTPASLQPTTEYTTPINDTPFTVPYLFDEDFGKVSAKDYAQLSWGSNGDAGISMDDVGLTGWTGAAWQTTANTSLMVAAYIGSSIAGTATDCTNGRVDTVQLPLKNAGVTITVTYMVSGKTTANAAQNSCYFGVTDTAGAISATTSYKTPATPDRLIESYVINNNGSATNISVAKTNTISACSPTTRLTWCCNPTSVGTSWLNYVTSKYFYIYIDNIKVSIGNQIK